MHYKPIFPFYISYENHSLLSGILCVQASSKTEFSVNFEENLNSHLLQGSQIWWTMGSILQGSQIWWTMGSNGFFLLALRCCIPLTPGLTNGGARHPQKTTPHVHTHSIQPQLTTNKEISTFTVYTYTPTRLI